MTTVHQRYQLHKRIGKGSFGEVYIGTDLVTEGIVAIKLEDRGQKNVLAHEHEIYRALSMTRTPLRIPHIYWFGTHETRRVMVMQYLGNSLESQMRSRCGGKFSLKTTLMLGIQMFDLLERLHGNSYIHRDLKPENFLMGVGAERHHVYLIDFGLAKRYKTEDKVHIKAKTDKNIVGTARYASVHSHNGVELSRRDDLESFLYLMVYFLKGHLPWQGLPVAGKEEKYKAIGELKASILPERLCEGLPAELCQFLTFVRALQFKERPDYQKLRKLLVQIFDRMGYSFDYVYDWDGPQVLQ